MPDIAIPARTLRMRQRHRGEMAAGGPAGHHDAAGRRRRARAIARRDNRSPAWISADDLVERRIRRQRVADQRDIDAMRHRAFGEQRKRFLGAGLPIAAVDEQQRRRLVGGLEEIDPVALARAIAEVEMIGVLRFASRAERCSQPATSSTLPGTATPLLRPRSRSCWLMPRQSSVSNDVVMPKSPVQPRRGRVSTLPENVLQHWQSATKRNDRERASG